MTRGWLRCTRCVLSARFPRIEFDEEGVCSFCRDNSALAAETDALDRARVQVAGLFSGRTHGRRYDALACLSGGKDSTFALMLATRKYGLRTLAFTFDNGFLSAAAFDNIRKATDALGVDHIMVRHSSSAMKAIFRAGAAHRVYPPATLSRISAVCKSCITMVNTTALTLALEKGIPFIVAGFTPGQIPAGSAVYRPNHGFLQESRRDAIAALGALTGRSVAEYFTLRDELLGLPSPWHVNLLCLEEAGEDRILGEVGSIGWRRPDDVDGCSSNCRLNGLANHVHEAEYGYNPYEFELSSLVRRGLLTRQQAIAKLDDGAGPQLREIMAELGLEAIKAAGMPGSAEATACRGAFQMRPQA